MKDGWQTKKLGDVCHVYQPETISQKQMIAGRFRVYGANGQIGWHNQFNHEESELILGCRGSCGTVHVTEPRSWINGNAMVVHPTNGVMEISFLAYALKGGIKLADAITGTAQPQITRTSLMPLAISFPTSLAEQQRIVGILDEAFEGIATAKANAEKNLQNARDLFGSQLQSVFAYRGEGWGERPLEDVASILNGYSFKSGDFSAKRGAKCIKITNVGVRDFVCESDEYLPESFAAQYAKVSVKKGSIVLALTRTIISGGLKVAVVPDEYDGALLNQRVAAIVTNHDVVSSAFLFAYLSTQKVVDYVKDRVNTLMQPNLSIVDLRAMLVPVPPFKVQAQIINQIESVRKETQHLVAIYERKLAALDELKKSLLHQAFSGEL
jgi:type I restriction enzyme S subunit